MTSAHQVFVRCLPVCRYISSARSHNALIGSGPLDEGRKIKVRGRRLDVALRIAPELLAHVVGAVQGIIGGADRVDLKSAYDGELVAGSGSFEKSFGRDGKPFSVRLSH